MENKILIGAVLAFLVMATGAVYYPTILEAVTAIQNRQALPTLSFNSDIEIVEDYHEIDPNTGEQGRRVFGYDFDVIATDPNNLLNRMSSDQIKEEYGNREIGLLYWRGGTNSNLNDTEIKELVKNDAVFRLEEIQKIMDKELINKIEFDEDIRVRPEDNLIGWAYDTVTKTWSDRS